MNATQIEKPKQESTQKEKNISPREFLEQNLPNYPMHTSYVIKDLWPNHFRVNYYKEVEGNLIGCTRLIGSYFISVEKSPDGYSLKNHTIDDTPKQKG